MSSTARAERNRRIAADRAAGYSWAAIASRHGISERQAQRGRVEHIRAGAASAALSEDIDAVLREAVAIHREVLDGLAAVGAKADNSAAQVGALRARAATSKQLVELLAWAGLVPESAGAWQFARDVRGLATVFVEVMTKHGLADHVEEILAELDRIAGVPIALAGAVA